MNTINLNRIGTFLVIKGSFSVLLLENIVYFCYACVLYVDTESIKHREFLVACVL